VEYIVEAMKPLIFSPDSLESTAIAEARFNSEMLFEDAKLLFDAKRWGTCISMAILACEEAGKFIIFFCNLGTPFHSISELRNHNGKLSVFSERLHSLLRLRALDDYFCELGKIDRMERFCEIAAYYDACIETLFRNNDSVEAILSDPALASIWMEVRRRVSQDEAYRIAEKAAMGELDLIKQRGLYVDATATSVLSPRDFSKEDAILYLRAAEIVVDSIVIKDSVTNKDDLTPLPGREG
jgi:AbiV family abortive infection protein